MGDYIKRDDAIMLLHLSPTIESAEDEIRGYPAADVRENVRGEWIGKPKQENIFCRICSNCNQYSPVSFYCINCGAEMRGENR